MFTGLVLGMGTIVQLTPLSSEARLQIRPLFPVASWVKGESVAINGTCLSVENFDAQTFTAYASHETLDLTNLKDLSHGAHVNLERALQLSSRLGGHLVSGHIDGIATVESITPKGLSKVIRLSFSSSFARQVIPKGSVTLDGISLTINTCGADFLEVNIIPETQNTTTIGFWKKGQKVNFETDLIGKYVERMLFSEGQTSTPKENRIDMNFLREHGF